MPDISVIIPLYNKGPFIARALGSVLGQTVGDFEIFVVDDGSTDDGPAVVKRFSDRRVILVAQENRGAAAARNVGVEAAGGDLVSFLDADDEWTASHLETTLRLCAAFPGAGMYATAYRIQTPDSRLLLAHYKGIPSAPWEGLLPNYFESLARGERSELLGEFPVNASVVSFPKRIFNEFGGFPEGCWFGEDMDLFGRIALRYPIAFSWEVGAIYHRDAAGRACNRARPLDYEEPFVRTAREALGRRETPPEFVGPLREYISVKEIPRAGRNVLSGNSNDALDILKRCKTRRHLAMKAKWYVLAKLPFFLWKPILRMKECAKRMLKARRRA